MKKPRRILVGLKTLEHAVPLVDVACRISAPRASLLLVHIIELPDVTPLLAEVPDLEAAAQRILRAAARVAARSGRRFRTLDLRAHDAGAALLEILREEQMDLAVLGYHHRKTLGEILLGTTAQRVLRRAPCPVLLMVPPRPAK
jgi:nucleotide-binding universal stress UspA family protein